MSPRLADDLPEDLLTDALSRLACATEIERAAAINELVALRPDHAVALRALSAAISNTDALLSRGFGRCTTIDDPVEIGPYRVVDRLGAGAFGVVYRCAQDSPIQREVAVKVLRPGVGDARTLARFELERQVLVGLQHECIASVLDAGALPDGRPYFAMPIVEGVPITVHCDRERLSVAHRLRLFLDLCAGVQHAHLRGVIHRDLKPANVLVAVRDGSAIPKIIDFGIAKLAHGRTTANGGTHGARVVGTPGYMSPEQAIGASFDVDARTDVFALGVLLYELLVGHLPWDAGCNPCGRELQAPSAGIGRGRVGAPEVARLRATTESALVAKLRGDLDRIVGKALAFDPSHRYQSALELAEDVGRHLSGDVVLARAPSRAYRVRCFARRHRVGLSAAGLVLTALAAGLVASLVFYRESERRRVETEAALARERDARAAAAVGFDSALGAVDALLLRVADLRTDDGGLAPHVRRALLGDALAFYDRLVRDHGHDPRLRDEMLRAREAVAALHQRLGDSDRARAIVGELIAELSVDPTRERSRRGTALALLARLEAGRDDAAARAAWQCAIEELDAAPGDPATLGLLAAACAGYGDFLLDRDRNAASLPPLERALALAEQFAAAAPDDPARRAAVVLRRARLVDARLWSDAVQADADIRQLRDECVRLASHDAALAPLVVCWSEIARCHVERDRPADAETALEVAVSLQRRVAQRDAANPAARRTLAELLHRLARAYGDSADAKRADAAGREAIDLAVALVRDAPEDPEFVLALAQASNQFAAILLGRMEPCALVEAESACAAAVTAVRGLPESFAPRVRTRVLANSLGNLGYVIDARGGDSTQVWCEVLSAYREIHARWPGTVSDEVNFCRAAARRATRALAVGDHAIAVALCAEVRERGQPAPGSKSHARQFAQMLRIEAELRALRGDDVGAAACARELAPWCGDWRICALAADADWFAWCAASVPARAAVHAERAAAGYAAVTAELASAMLGESATFTRGRARVRHAMLALRAGDAEQAAQLAAAGLSDLDAVRGALHVFLWDDVTDVTAHWVLARAELARGAWWAAARVAHDLAQRLPDDAVARWLAADLLAACAVCAPELAEAARASRGEALAAIAAADDLAIAPTATSLELARLLRDPP